LIVLLFLLTGSRARSWVIAIEITILSGVILWIFGRNANHVGASALISGLIAFLILGGFFERRLVPIVVAVVTFVLYGGSLIWESFPTRRRYHGTVTCTGAIAVACSHFSWPVRRSFGRRLRSGKHHHRPTTQANKAFGFGHARDQIRTRHRRQTVEIDIAHMAPFAVRWTSQWRCPYRSTAAGNTGVVQRQSVPERVIAYTTGWPPWHRSQSRATLIPYGSKSHLRRWERNVRRRWSSAMAAAVKHTTGVPPRIARPVASRRRCCTMRVSADSAECAASGTVENQVVQILGTS